MGSVLSRPLIEGIAGAAGGFVSLAIVFPLTEQQQKEESSISRLIRVFKEEGVGDGLYKGFSSGLVAMLVSMFLYFYAHSVTKGAMKGMLGQQNLGPLQDLLAASAAGAVTCVLSNPVWVINTRLMLQKRKKNQPATKGDLTAQTYSGWIDCFIKIGQQEGVEGYIKGVGPALGTVLNTGIQFMVYEQIRQLLVKLRGSASKISGLEFFLLGAVAKCVSTIATYPSQTVARRMQTVNDTSETGAAKPISSWQLASDMLLKEGIGSFYQGLRPRLVQMVLQNAIKLYGFEMVVASALGAS